MEEDTNIIQWFDDYHRKQLAEIREAKKTWWNQPDQKDNDIYVYNK